MNKDGIFNPNDNEVYAALNSHKITKIDMAKLFLKRGIIVSPNDTKEKSAFYFSSFFISYFDHQDIHDCVSAASNRREMVSINAFKSLTPLSFSSIKDTLVSFAEASEGNTEGKINIDKITVTGNNDTALISFDYSSYDYGNSEFTRQVKKKTAFRISQVDKNNFLLEAGNNEEAKIWQTQLSLLLSEKNDLEKEEEINLTGITNQLKKRQFFDRLTKEIEGFTYYDVIKVDVIRPIQEGEKEDKDHVKSGYKIRSAKFDGEGLMQSSELDSFLSQGFQLYRISWECINDAPLSLDLYQFEARFADAENCNNFEYIAKGFKKKIEDGYASKPIQLTSAEEIKLHTKIYQAAVKIMLSLKALPVPNLPKSEAPNIPDNLTQQIEGTNEASNSDAEIINFEPELVNLSNSLQDDVSANLSSSDKTP